MGAIKCDVFAVNKDTLCAIHWFDKDAVESDAVIKMKRRLSQQWASYIDDQILITLRRVHPPMRRHSLVWSSELALWSFGLNLFRGE